ncbi:uncharacterized protein LOC143863347 [Tasmannia lanceolata]|uniref:uncharacterized protein LOC143863347 n=1 Tax=Tasmannia lanceolata TaxID=3420 RepID=UPI004064BD30
MYPTGTILRNWLPVVTEKKQRTKLLPRWCPPPKCWIKLNFDGSSSGNPGRAGIGGVLRDHLGNLIMHFSKPAEICDANEAEVSVLLFALQWYANHNLGPLIVEGDSSNTIAWASNQTGGLWRMASKIDEIRDLNSSPRPLLRHRRRSANDWADSLAKERVDQDGLSIFVVGNLTL